MRRRLPCLIKLGRGTEVSDVSKHTCSPIQEASFAHPDLPADADAIAIDEDELCDAADNDEDPASAEEELAPAEEELTPAEEELTPAEE